MEKNISIIGGDLRMVKLAIFLSENNKIKTYGLEDSDEIQRNERIQKCDSIEQALREVDFVIGPIPFSSNMKTINAPFFNKDITINELIQNFNSKIFIAGNISKDILEIMEGKNIKVIDIMKQEEMVILNTIATAEGTIEVAMKNTEKIIHGSNVLVLGFGRVGKIVAEKFANLLSNVTCAVRKNIDKAWIEAYGYQSMDINNLCNLENFDIIINTVPYCIIQENELKQMRKDVLLIDLASTPGGIDREAVKKQNKKFVWALSLPGKVAPVTTAKYIKDTIYNILENS